MTKHIKFKKNKADLMNTFLTIQPPYFKSSPLNKNVNRFAQSACRRRWKLNDVNVQTMTKDIMLEYVIQNNHTQPFIIRKFKWNMPIKCLLYAVWALQCSLICIAFSKTIGINQCIVSLSLCNMETNRRVWKKKIFAKCKKDNSMN